MRTTKTKILSWIGKTTRTDIDYITRNGAWLFGGGTISIFLSLLLTLAFANLLPQDIYGTYRYLVSIMSIVGIFTITGLTNTIPQSVSRGYYNSLRDGLALQKKWLVVPLAFTMLLSLYYFFNGNLILSKSLLIILVLFPFYKVVSLFDSYLVGKKDFKRKTLFNFIQNIIATSSLLLCLYFSDNIYLIIFIYLITLVVPSFIFLQKTLKDLNNIPTENKISDLGFKENSFHLSFLNGIGKVASEIDKILIFHFLGPIKLAIYSFASAPISKAEGSLLMIRDLILPKISLRTAKELKATLPKKIIIFSLLLIPLIILYVVFSPYLYSYFLPNYMESIPYTRYLSLSLVFSLPILVFNQTLIAQMQKRGLYTTRIISPLIKIALMIVLIPKLDILGAVLSVIMGSIANIIILSILFSRMKDITLTKSEVGIINE